MRDPVTRDRIADRDDVSGVPRPDGAHRAQIGAGSGRSRENSDLWMRPSQLRRPDTPASITPASIRIQSSSTTTAASRNFWAPSKQERPRPTIAPRLMQRTSTQRTSTQRTSMLPAPLSGSSISSSARPSCSLRSLHACLRPGAVLVLTTPSTFYPPAFFRDSTHRTAFCDDEWGGLLELCGFEVEACYRLYHAPSGAEGPSSWVHRAIGIDYARQIAIVARRRSLETGGRSLNASGGAVSRAVSSIRPAGSQARPLVRSRRSRVAC